MKRLYKFLFVALSGAAIVFSTSQDASTFSSGGPFGNTGSTGDGANNTCAKGGCHVGTPDTGPGTVSLDVSDIPSSGYAPGETYTIGVTVAESGRNTFGFQVTAENNAGSKQGTYTAGSGTKIMNSNWITHSMTNGTGSWSFSWTAPSSTEDIIFHAVGNAANSDGNATGDNIYTGSVSVSRDPIASVDNLVSSLGLKIYNLYNQKSIVFELERDLNFVMYNMSGSKVREFHLDRGQTNVDFSTLNSGQYLITEISTGFTKRVVLN